MIKSYKDITILKFQEIQAAIEMNHSEVLLKEEVEHFYGLCIAQWYNILPLVTDKDKAYYMSIKYGQFKQIVKEYSWIMTEAMPDEWVKDFTVNGEKYLVVQFATDWNTDQFTSMGILTMDQSQIINNLHKILAAMCVKEGEMLPAPLRELVPLSEYERRQNLFQDNLCILAAYPIGFFFAAFLAKLSQTTQYSSHLKQMENAMKMSQKRMEVSTPNTDGTT